MVKSKMSVYKSSTGGYAGCVRAKLWNGVALEFSITKQKTRAACTKALRDAVTVASEGAVL